MTEAFETVDTWDAAVTKEREIVQDWDGMVCYKEDHFDELEDAIMLMVDGCYYAATETTPAHYKLEELDEFVECCALRAPQFTIHKNHFKEALEGLVTDIDESDEGSGCDGDDYFSENVNEEKFNALLERVTAAAQKELDEWLDTTAGYKLWFPIGKFIEVAPLAQKHLAELEAADQITAELEAKQCNK